MYMYVLRDVFTYIYVMGVASLSFWSQDSLFHDIHELLVCGEVTGLFEREEVEEISSQLAEGRTKKEEGLGPWKIFVNVGSCFVCFCFFLHAQKSSLDSGIRVGASMKWDTTWQCGVVLWRCSYNFYRMYQCESLTPCICSRHQVHTDIVHHIKAGWRPGNKASRICNLISFFSNPCPSLFTSLIPVLSYILPHILPSLPEVEESPPPGAVLHTLQSLPGPALS